MNLFSPSTFSSVPKNYFDPAVCTALDVLDGIAEAACLSVVTNYDPDKVDEHLIDDEVYLQETRTWNRFYEAAEDTRKQHRIINPANRPYDYHWCLAHLVLYTNTRALLAFISVNPHASFVGSVCLSNDLCMPAPTAEVTKQFRSLKEQISKIDAAQREATGFAMPTLTHFEP